MTTREAFVYLHAKGANVTCWRLRGMIDRGEIPRPRLNSSLVWDWTPELVQKAFDLTSQEVVAS